MSTLYPFNTYIAWRAMNQRPINGKREAFYNFCQGERVMTLEQWENRYQEFIRVDAQDEREQERLDGLEDTAQAALAGHFEPVAA